MKGILTLTVITQRATSLNYGENIGNVSILKKLSLDDGSQVTYVSDKALKYEIRKAGRESFGWNLLDEKIKSILGSRLDRNKLDVDSFGKELVKEYHEFDLFGGLLTSLKVDGKKVELSYGDSVKRISPVKLTYAFSIGKFQGDMDFMNNIDAYNRYIKHIEDKASQTIVQSEQHSSYYHYTLAIDLDRIGVWEGESTKEEVVDNEEKANRVKQLLGIVFTLSRQIRGRWENLSPVFVIGGIYEVKNPFFLGCVSAKEVEDGKLWLDVQKLLDCRSFALGGETLCGIISGVFANEEKLRNDLSCRSTAEVLEELSKRVEEVYGVSKG